MSPAELLAGLKLENGWSVEKLIPRSVTATGGNFSRGYIAKRSDGMIGFLKAIDVSEAFRSADMTTELNRITSSYNFERAICEQCAHLSRIARAIQSGTVAVNPTDPTSRVPYLIFEMANGDIRQHLDMSLGLDYVFILKTLHHVATGLSQLHHAEIAHQDLKPSNVLIFKSTNESKICDLGRAWSKANAAPHDNYAIAGDQNYSPPELSYGDVPVDHIRRRFGCDHFHLGSLTVFLFTRTHTNALLMDNLKMSHRPYHWRGTYRDVLPHLQAAFEESLNIFCSQTPPFLADELRQIVSELCNPDIERRGHPLNRNLNQFGLERYISKFNRLSHIAKLELVKHALIPNATN